MDVPGNGNCGLYAVLVGLGVIKPSEFGKPTHPDQGPHPSANAYQESLVQQLRVGAAKTAKEQLKEADGSYTPKNSETIRRIRTQYESLADEDFKYVAESLGCPIEVYSHQPGGVARTLFRPNKEPQFLFQGVSEPSAAGIIRLHLSNGHYQLMQPIKSP